MNYILATRQKHQAAKGALPPDSAQVEAGRFARLAALALGLLATLSSAVVTILAGQERGSTGAEQAAWIAIGLVLLLSAHLIPTLSQSATARLRLGVGILWLFSLLATGYTHATFFVNAQRHAGEARAEQIPLASIPSTTAGRAPDVIAKEGARITVDLENAREATCIANCKWLTLRRTSLAAKLAALNIELDEARHREAILDEQRAERVKALAVRERAMRDPVTLRLAGLLNANEDTVNLVIALAIGVLLELVASVSWILAFPPQEAASAGRHSGIVTSQDVERKRLNETMPAPQQPAEVPIFASTVQGRGPRREPANESVARSSQLAQTAVQAHPRRRTLVVLTADLTVAATAAPIRTACEGYDAPEATDDELLVELVRAVHEGELRPTLNAIKRYLDCNEGKAMALRSRLVIRHPDLFCEPMTASS